MTLVQRQVIIYRSVFCHILRLRRTSKAGYLFIRVSRKYFQHSEQRNLNMKSNQSAMKENT